MRRRPISPFSLSFLDIMFCGFGAVVLLVLILNTDTVKARNQTFADLRAEAVRLERERLNGEQDLVELRNSLQASERELVQAQGEAERVRRLLNELEVARAALDRETLARREHANRLKTDLRQLDEDQQRLGAELAAAREPGRQVHEIVGQGDRQYLTGLKLGGKRVLILLDASASMLDETIVNVIRRRNLEPTQRRGAPKWRRALATTEWLIANLPPDARFQLYRFNTQAEPVLKDSAGTWLTAADPRQVGAVLRSLEQLAPEDGTSLYKAFAAADRLQPKPDNILLITDGLPTQGKGTPWGSKVSGEKRLKHFTDALKQLPKGVPVNTILLPMEGDPYAAAAFWQLAQSSRGSFLTPARDWP
jgi:hypothetical protein